MTNKLSPLDLKINWIFMCLGAIVSIYSLCVIGFGVATGLTYLNVFIGTACFAINRWNLKKHYGFVKTEHPGWKGEW